MGLCTYIYLYFYILLPCLCSFLACHPYISFQIFSFPVSICMAHFLNKLLWILCLATHWEWVWLFCVMVNIANMDLLHSFHGEGAWSFCIPCLRTVHLSFHASGIKMCTPGYPAVVACLCLQVWSKYAQIHMLLYFFFFYKNETTTHLPHDMQQSCAMATFKCGSQQLLAIWMADTGTSTVDGDTEHPRASRPRIMNACVPTHAEKAFNFKLWLFKKWRKGSIETKISKFLFLVKKAAGNFLKN